MQEIHGFLHNRKSVCPRIGDFVSGVLISFSFRLMFRRRANQRALFGSDFSLAAEKLTTFRRSQR